MVAGDLLRRKSDGQLVKVICCGPRSRIWCEWPEAGFYHDAVYGMDELTTETVTPEAAAWQPAKDTGPGSKGFVE